MIDIIRSIKGLPFMACLRMLRFGRFSDVKGCGFYHFPHPFAF